MLTVIARRETNHVVDLPVLFFFFFLIHALTCATTLCSLRSDILSLLRTYNCYHEGKNFQLRTREVRQPTKMYRVFTVAAPVRLTAWGLHAALLYKFGHRHKQNWNKLTTARCDSRVNNEGQAGRQQTSSSACAVSQQGSETSEVCFPTGPNGRATTETLYTSCAMRMEIGYYTFQTYIRQVASRICPRFICFSVLRASRSPESGFENPSIRVLRSGVPLGVKAAGSYVKECACARASVLCVSV